MSCEPEGERVEFDVHGVLVVVEPDVSDGTSLKEEVGFVDFAEVFAEDEGLGMDHAEFQCDVEGGVDAVGLTDVEEV